MIVFDSDWEATVCEWLYHTLNQLIPKREDFQFLCDRAMIYSYITMGHSY